eukprot:scaffold1385_cov115-Isochrysis_galbana.AAC.2
MRSMAVIGFVSEWPTIARRRTSSNGKVVVDAHMPATIPNVAAGDRPPPRSSPARTRARVESLRV